MFLSQVLARDTMLLATVSTVRGAVLPEAFPMSVCTWPGLTARKVTWDYRVI